MASAASVAINQTRTSAVADTLLQSKINPDLQIGRKMKFPRIQIIGALLVLAAILAIPLIRFIQQNFQASILVKTD